MSQSSRVTPSDGHHHVAGVHVAVAHDALETLGPPRVSFDDLGEARSGGGIERAVDFRQPLVEVPPRERLARRQRLSLGSERGSMAWTSATIRPTSRQSGSPSVGTRRCHAVAANSPSATTSSHAGSGTRIPRAVSSSASSIDRPAVVAPTRPSRNTTSPHSYSALMPDTQRAVAPGVASAAPPLPPAPAWRHPSSTSTPGLSRPVGSNRSLRWWWRSRSTGSTSRRGGGSS